MEHVLVNTVGWLASVTEAVSALIIGIGVANAAVLTVAFIIPILKFIGPSAT